MESCEIEINDLPNEIIIKILRCLGKSDLQRAILTCKLWKNIIESACPWSIKVNCKKLSRVNSPQYKFLATTERKFRSIELKGSLLVSEEIAVIDTVRRHGSSVVKLSLFDIRLGALVTLAEILRYLPNLNELIVFRAQVMDYPLRDLVEDDIPMLPKLETLQITASEYRILKCFKKAKVKTFKMINSTYSHSYRCDTLEDFLKTQDKLTTLALRSIYHSHSMLFCTANLNGLMPFQLTRLSLLYIQLVDDDYSNLLSLIEKHAKSLKELQLGHKFHHTIYECVFAKMTNLETLYLMMSEIPQDEQMLRRLRKNRSIQSLIIRQAPRDTFDSIPFFRGFFKCLPNVTTLSILTEFPKAMIEVMAENLTQLKVLQVSEYHAEFCGIPFPNLNALHIDVLSGKVDWQIFSRAHPKLTEFSLDLYDGVDWTTEDFSYRCDKRANDRNFEEIAKITKANVHLHTLTFGNWFKADARTLEVLRMNCPQLKALNLDKNCAVANEPHDQSWMGILRFCEFGYDLYHLRSPFWTGHPYEDDEIWEEEAVRDMFDYYVQDIPMVGRPNTIHEIDDLESDEAGESD